MSYEMGQDLKVEEPIEEGAHPTLISRGVTSPYFKFFYLYVKT